MNKEKLRKLMQDKGYEEISEDDYYKRLNGKDKRVLYSDGDVNFVLYFKPKENHTSAITGMSAPDCTKGEFSEAPADAQTQKEKGCGKTCYYLHYCGEKIKSLNNKEIIVLCPECQEKEKPQETEFYFSDFRLDIDGDLFISDPNSIGYRRTFIIHKNEFEKLEQAIKKAREEK